MAYSFGEACGYGSRARGEARPDSDLDLAVIVRRHLRTLRLGLDAAYPEEDWGFTAQQTAEKLVNGWIVLADRRPPRRHELMDWRPWRMELLALLEAELERCERVVGAAG